MFEDIKIFALSAFREFVGHSKVYQNKSFFEIKADESLFMKRSQYNEESEGLSN